MLDAKDMVVQFVIQIVIGLNPIVFMHDDTTDDFVILHWVPREMLICIFLL